MVALNVWSDAAHPCLLVHVAWKKWPKFVRFFFKRGQNLAKFLPPPKKNTKTKDGIKIITKVNKFHS